VSFINTLFRALIFAGIIIFLLYTFQGKSKSDIKYQLTNIIPKDTLVNAPPVVINYVIQNIPVEKQSKVASLSAELASASASWQPYKEEKIKELKLMIIDELYKTAIETIKK